MADFVAVIRRAVDGLADNSPDNRAKVYDKARGAVRRQLEAMNPRPSDDLLQRQLDKLEAAIGEVENEHTVALPADDTFAEEIPAASAETYEAPELAAEVTEPEPVATAPVYEPEIAEEPVSPPAPVEPPAYEPVVEPPVYEPAVEQHFQQPDPAPEPEPAYEQTAQYAPEAEVAQVPEAETHHWHDEPAHWQQEPAEEPQSYAPVVEESVHPDAVTVAEDEPAPEYIGMQPAEPAHDHTEFVEQAAAYYEHPEPAVEPTPVEAQPEPPANPGLPSAAMPWEWSDERHDAEPEEVVAHDVIAEEERAQHVVASETPADAAKIKDAAPEWSWPDEAKFDEPAPEQKKAADNAWSDLEDLIGYQHPKTEPGAKVAASEPQAAAPAEPVRTGQRSFRAEPSKPKISLAKIGAAVVALAVVGGAGAGYWLNRDAINGMVADLTTSEPAAPKQASNGDPATSTGAASGAAGTQVAANDSGSTKFTQRLLPNGTETDEGPAEVIGASTEEGKSIAEQSTEVAAAETVEPAGTATDGSPVAGTPPAGNTDTDTQAAAQAPATGAPTAPVTQSATAGAAAEQAPIGVAQKMFIYEERLGQSAPTAIEGTVVWSKGEDSPGGDAKPEPVIRAQLNAASNGLAAQITIRRNADKSLPASHLVEIVFALPPNFEGGNIDSVQRVAMKQTEQDRGDPLIAVPAKITEDFHMIALNDFPDAITRNTELLKTRDWIDIPITYRNGRRALITLEKGTTGAEVFNSVMNAWAALGPTASQ